MVYKNKKKMALLAIIILLGLIMPSISAATDYRTIRVRITMESSSIESASIELNGDYMLVQDPELLLPSGSYTITVDEDGETLRLTGQGINQNLGSEIQFIRMEYSGTSVSTIQINDTYHGDIKYLGDMRFHVSDGSILVTNHVPLEEYLYGVVAYEMSNTFPLEALKAQAVCARGYAIQKIIASSTKDYDIGDTASTQVYKGYNPSYTKVIQAVNETKGKVVAYNDSIITTYYAASNGGQTELISNVWGGSDLPYFVQKDDPYDLNNPSSMVRRVFLPVQIADSKYDAMTLEQVVRVVNISTYLNIRSGPGTSYQIIDTAYLNDLFEYLETDQDSGWHKIAFYKEGVLTEGYVSPSYSVVEDNQENGFLYGNPVINDLQHRVFEKVKDTVEVTQAAQIKVNQVTRFENGVKRWPDTDSRCYVTAIADVVVQYKNADGSLSEEVTVEDVSIDLLIENEEGGYTYVHDYLNKYLRMRGVEASQDAEGNVGYDIVCLRYGHGVGMSQRGAQQMAVEGKTYSEIIAFYFEGTTLKTYETTVPELPSRGEETPTAPVPIVTSTVYTIGANSISGVDENTPVGTFLQNFVVKDGTLSLAAEDNTEKTTGNVVLGDVLHVKDNNGEIVKTYSISMNESEEEPAPAPVVTSTVYAIEESSVSGVDENTSVETFLQNFTVTDGTLNLAAEDNTEKTTGNVVLGDVLRVKDNNGEIVKTYSISINESEEEPVPDPAVTTTVYTMDSNSVAGISEKTSVETFMGKFTVTNGTITLTDSDDKAKTTGNISTGDVLHLKDGDGETIESFTVVIYGDVSGDGGISIADLLTIQRHLLDVKKLTGTYQTAGDVNKDGKVSIADLLVTQRHLLKVSEISQ